MIHSYGGERAVAWVRARLSDASVSVCVYIGVWGGGGGGGGCDID